MVMDTFRIEVPQAALDDLARRLDHVRWPAHPAAGWGLGVDQDYLRSLVAYWRHGFDWRAQEAELNRLAQIRCSIDGIDLHVVHERGKGPDPLPIILTHGWPDSYLRYRRIIPLLTDPAAHGADPADSFDVVVPSVPGFGFSGYPSAGGLTNRGVAQLWAKLMTEELGYARFGAGGGDVGSGVTRYLAFERPELLIGIHLTDIGIVRQLLAAPDAGLSPEELSYKRAASDWIAQEGGYIAIQSTKPQTLAYGLSDSPVGLAAWITEKLRAWSDCQGDLRTRFSDDEVLTNVMLYWVNNSAATSAQLYYENSHGLPPLGRIEVPTGVAVFAGDVLPPPREWAERNLAIRRWTRLPRGGHFAPMEEPELLADEIRAFFRPLRDRR